jgi:hypothetical protein
MQKAFIVIVMMLAVLVSGAARADTNADCLNSFHQTKDMSCVDALINAAPKLLPMSADKKIGINPGLLGFMAEVFSEYPDKKAQIVAQDVPGPVRPFIAMALYMAGLPDEAESYANAKGVAPIIARLKSDKTLPLKQLLPTLNPSDNDILIGAYDASGNKEYIQRILQNFSDVDDGMVHASIRLGLMEGKFGPTSSPAGRDKPVVAMTKAACAKYACKSDMNSFMRLMTLASAFWAVYSVSQHDEVVRKSFETFFDNDPRLKEIVTEESAGFGNYQTSLAAYAAVKDNPKLTASLTAYETLEPLQAVSDAMDGKSN